MHWLIKHSATYKRSESSLSMISQREGQQEIGGFALGEHC